MLVRKSELWVSRKLSLSHGILKIALTLTASSSQALELVQLYGVPFLSCSAA